MKNEQPTQTSPEEIAELEKSRAIAEGKLLEGGAEYVIDSEGKKILITTEEQMEELKMEHKREQIPIDEREQRIIKQVESQNIKSGNLVDIVFDDDKKFFNETDEGTHALFLSLEDGWLFYAPYRDYSSKQWNGSSGKTLIGAIRIKSITKVEGKLRQNDAING
jgi:hypothetical protein